jgi:biopolymer transport protein TolQ
VQLWTAFLHTGWVGKAVLAILLLFSIGSWGVMLVVGRRFGRSAAASRRFMSGFRRAKRLADVQAATKDAVPSSLVGLFKAGYAEIEAQIAHAQGGPKIQSLDGVERSLMRASRIEAARLSRFVPFLATTAAATPFIGLFGTVWGIMNAFRGLSNVAQATLAQVAPGIAEALVATAMGLFAAIPAVIAYNRFSHDIDRLASRYESFMEELQNILQRQAHLPDRDATDTVTQRPRGRA